MPGAIRNTEPGKGNLRALFIRDGTAEKFVGRFSNTTYFRKGKTPGFVDIPVKSSRRRINIFGFPRLSPALIAFAAALLFIWGINLFWVNNSPAEKDGDKYLAGTGVGNSQLQFDSSKFEKRPTTDWQDETGKERLPENNESLKAVNNFPAGSKSLASKNIKIKQKPVLLREKKNQPGEILLNEEEQAILRTKLLETEIAAQIEKVELLLRSFRNSRLVGSVENFDVEYERRQARKLLEKNTMLRRGAENYGITYAEELLSRIEPYLLDIANLEATPAPNKVLDIKKRVSNQNIIASLQVY